MFTASICTIGDEILIGQIVDTNSSAISRALGEIGIKTTHMVSLSDNRSDIISTLTREISENDIVVVTGGLGPTKDDITKAALAELSGSSSYVLHEGQAEMVRLILHSRGLDTLENNADQAMVPDSCRVFVNHFGTAPIMAFDFPATRFGHKAVLYSMPGVPHETISALPDVVEDISRLFNTGKIAHRNLMTYGIAESALSKLIESWEDSLPEDIHLAYLPNTLTGVRLRLSIYDGSSLADKRLEAEIERLKPILGDYLYAESDSNLESAIGALLRGTGKTLSAAESCTGGQISHMITSVSGSSEYYLGSVTSYAVKIKNQVLGVPIETIENEGIVSSAVAAAMAEGIRRLTGSTFSVATTGWADAYGDEREPAGTVWIAVSGPKGTKTLRCCYHNDRKRNIERFAASALNFLRVYIQSELKN